MSGSSKVTPEEAAIYQARGLSDPHGLAPMLERARVVGVLDAWADALGHRVWAMIRNSSGGWAVELHEGADGQESSTVLGHATTPDAARAATAKAIEAGEV